MATSDYETLVDLPGEISEVLEADVSCGPSSHRMDLGSVILGNRIDGNAAAEPKLNLVRIQNHRDKLSTTTFSTLHFSDSLLKWSSISIGAYIGAFFANWPDTLENLVCDKTRKFVNLCSCKFFLFKEMQLKVLSICRN
jgi:hypothetical protein